MSGHEHEPDPRHLMQPEDVPSVPCSLVHDLLPAAVGGDLEPETEAALLRHVKECLQCAREWHGLADSHYALLSLADGGAADLGLDDAFFADLHDGIVGEVKRQSRLARDGARLRAQALRRRRRAGLLPMIALAGTLAATLALGVFVGRGFRAGSPESLPTASTERGGTAEADLVDMVADPAFTPFLVEAIRRYVERRSSNHRVEPTVGVTFPLADAGRGADSQETDF